MRILHTLAALTCTLLATTAHAERVKDIASVAGVRGNQLIGYGLVVGLDTNFYAASPQQVKTGMLLGQPASVRFTPVQYRWDYGDGVTSTRATPGATWRALGVQEFDPTPTSHIYRDPGTYYIDLTIGFSPEYRYASETIWVPVPGIVWVPANRLVATAGGTKTVLVEDECTVNPSGPGC